MRWLRFSAAGRTAYGILEDETVIEVAGDPFGGFERKSRLYPLDAIKIELPVMPQTVYCAGSNYAAHVLAQASETGKTPKKIPRKPDIGYRTSSSLIAHNEPVIIPRDATEQIQYEGELVAVIGTKAKNLSEDNALSCVLGYTIGNDVSERSWQASDRTLWRAKNTDTFNPMGPWIETNANLENMETIVRVNGVETTRFATNAMLFGVATYISAMSRYATLYPGDVIWMGTSGTSPNLKSGDTVDVEITGIGTLRNPFVRADS